MQARQMTWPIRSGVLPPLADCHNPRSETRPGLASSRGAGAGAAPSLPRYPAAGQQRSATHEKVPGPSLSGVKFQHGSPQDTVAVDATVS